MVYIMLMVSAAIPSNGLVINVIPLMTAPIYYATDANNWAALFHRYIPSWTVPSGQSVIADFYSGQAPVPWDAWMVPLATWALLGGAMLWVYVSLAALLRRQWMDKERLTFPLAQVPLAMVDEKNPTISGGIFHSPYLWIGIAIPVVLHTLGGLNFYIPAVPSLNLTGMAWGSAVFTERPFDVWNNLTISFYPSLIGISYLIRAEVSMSFWVYYFVYNILKLAWSMMGLGIGSSPAAWLVFSRYHTAGALVGLALFVIWGSRQEIWAGLRGAVGIKTQARRPDEWMSPTWAARGFLVGTAIVLGWGLAAGIQFRAGIILYFLLLCMMIAYTRLVSAGGVLWVSSSWDPIHIMEKTMGAAAFTPASFTVMSFWTQAFTWHTNNFTMPYVMDGQKVSEGGRLAPKFVLGCVVLALVVSLIVSSAFMLQMIYFHGGDYLADTHIRDTPTWAFRHFELFLRLASPPDGWAVGYLISGIAVMVGMLLAHRSFLWWPVYPLAYIIGDTGVITTIWGSALVGWAAKEAIQRLGGSVSYSKFRPAFLGLILGEFFMVSLWVLIDAILDRAGHVILSS